MLQMQLRSGVAVAVAWAQVHLPFDPYARNFHMLQVLPFKRGGLVVPFVDQWVKNLTVCMKMWVQSLASLNGLKELVMP